MNIPQPIVDEFVGNAHGNLARVQELASQYPDILTARASWDETALDAAAQTASRPILDFLLERGVPPDIFSAIVLGQHDQVWAFLDRDPQLIRARGAHDLPILYYAAIVGDESLAKELLARGAEVNIDGAAETPLHGAVRFGQPGLVRWLLDQGADRNATDYDGRTPLQVAEQTGDATLAELLAES